MTLGLQLSTTRRHLTVCPVGCGTTTESTEVVLKLLDLQTLLCQLISKAPDLQARLLHHCREIDDSRPIGGRVTFWPCRLWLVGPSLAWRRADYRTLALCIC